MAESKVESTVDEEKGQIALADAQARLLGQQQQEGNELAQAPLQLQPGQLEDLAARVSHSN